MPDDANNQRIDDAIAEYTDRLLGQAKESAEPGRPPIQDEELTSLQKTVLKLKQAVPNQPPPPSFVARLRLAIFSEYRRMQDGAMQEHSARPGARSLWQRLVDGLRSPHGLAPRLVLVAAALAVILIYLPGFGESLPAAAGVMGIRPWVVIVFAAACIISVFWLIKEKK